MRRYIDFHMTFRIYDDTSEIHTACTNPRQSFVLYIPFKQHVQNILFVSIPFHFILKVTLLYLQLCEFDSFGFFVIETFTEYSSL